MQGSIKVTNLKGQFEIGSPLAFEDVVLGAFDRIQPIVNHGSVVESTLRTDAAAVATTGAAGTNAAAATTLLRLRHFQQRLRQFIGRHVMTFDANAVTIRGR